MKQDNENNDPVSPEETPDDSNAMLPMEDTPGSAELEEEEPSTAKRKKARVPKQYPGARKDLYPVCELMWDSCLEELAGFALFSQSYNEDLVEERKELISTVRALPDETERAEPHITERGLAEKSCLEYCQQWQLLKRYIIRSKFSSETAKLNLAGQQLYANASKFDWSTVQALIVAADKFTASHLADLTANLNMPPAFPAKLTLYGVNFNAFLTRFRNFEKVTEQLTDQKMTAENDLYMKTIEMGLDGQEIFKKEPAKARLFSYNAMLETVSGIGSASLVGTVTDSGNKQPVANATVAILQKELSATSNTSGKYSIGRLASGNYTVVVNAPGYMPATLANVQVEPGTSKRVNVQLAKL